MFSSKNSKTAPSVMRVKEHRPWLCPLLFVSTMIVIGIILLYVIFIGGYESFIQQQQQADMESVLQQNASFAKQNAELRSQLAMVIRTTQQSQKTYTQVLQSLSDLTEEINFYKRILQTSPAKKPSKLLVSKFSLSYDNNKKQYLYQIILTRWIAKAATGIMEINIEGEINGSRTNHTIEHIKYNFMFFKRINSNFQLPEGFTPHYLIVRFTSQEQQANEIRFKWADLQLKEQP
jgi:Tfp pilus assembly protein PilE